MPVQPSEVEKWVERLLGLRKEPSALLGMALGLAAAAATGVEWPHNWANWTAWTAAAGSFVLVFVAVAFSPHVLRELSKAISRRSNPTSIATRCHSGRTAILEIEQSGYPAEITARARTIDSGDGINPRPMWTSCRLHAVDERILQISIAESMGDFQVSTFLLGSLFPEESGTATVEVVFSATPPFRSGEITKRFAIWHGDQPLDLQIADEEDRRMPGRPSRRHRARVR